MNYGKTFCVSTECELFKECDDALTEQVKRKMDREDLKRISMCYNKCGEVSDE